MSKLSTSSLNYQYLNYLNYQPRVRLNMRQGPGDEVVVMLLNSAARRCSSRNGHSKTASLLTFPDKHSLLDCGKKSLCVCVVAYFPSLANSESKMLLHQSLKFKSFLFSASFRTMISTVSTDLQA